jgi:hypothetical protein
MGQNGRRRGLDFTSTRYNAHLAAGRSSHSLPSVGCWWLRRTELRRGAAHEGQENENLEPGRKALRVGNEGR